MRRLLPLLVYFAGVAAACCAGFLCPLPYLGFVPLAAGLIYAGVYLIDDGEELDNGDTAPAHRRR